MEAPVDASPSKAVIDRIRTLEEQLSGARFNSVRHRQLTIAIRAEADAYRRALDVEQVAKRFGPKPA